MLAAVLVIALFLLAAGALPFWPHSRDWGFAPSGLLAVVLIIVAILILTGRI